METIKNSNSKDLFKNFVNGKYKSVDEFICELRDLEKLYKKTLNKKNELWFKFSLDDTLATDINDLNRDLRSGSINHNFMLSNVVNAVINNTLFTYFS